MTGAAKGVGRGIAKQLALKGVAVVIAALEREITAMLGQNLIDG